MTSARRLCHYAIGAALLAGCPPKVPQELQEARAAYGHAAAGPSVEVAPAALHTAKVALADAEDAFKAAPHNYHTRDLAYVAARKAQLADALASTAVAEKAQRQAVKDYEVMQGEMLSRTREALDRKSGELDQASDALVAAEKAAIESNRRTADALAALAAVKQEPRGLVVTLSGSVLFASGQATLLAEAQERLGQVATALMDSSPRRPLIVEGHTDSDGSEAYNLDLSQRRADTVRDFLITRGYQGGLIQAHGIGEARPIASNDTPEGKANNRRVEIVVGLAIAAR